MRALAGLAALLVLTVVAASAAIRLGGAELGAALALVRVVHRAAASLAALVVAIVFVLSLRKKVFRRSALAALLLTLALSIVGWVTGTTPPPAPALFNQLGGIALAALLAWIWARGGAHSGNGHLANAALGLASLQAAFGALLAVLAQPPAFALLVAHAVLGLAAGATLTATGWRYAWCALLAAMLGVGVAAFPSPAIQVAHATAAALLLCATAIAQARSARA